jgi:hypothetical protein
VQRMSHNSSHHRPEKGSAKSVARNVAPGVRAILPLATLWLIACAAVLRAQQPAQPLATFTAPDGAFSFHHSGDLIRCQKTEQKDGGAGSWKPTENCVAYFPVCDGDVGPGQKSIACFAYPRNKFTNTKAFEAATFSVEIMDQVATEKDCLTGPPSLSNQTPRATTIGGVSFAVFELSDAGMNQNVSGHVYRTFHRGVCYQLGINLATANAQAFDPPVVAVTQDDLQQINNRLEQARDSFRFLK